MGTLVSIRTFLERRSMTVCLVSLVTVFSVLGMLYALASRGGWYAVEAAYGAVLAWAIYGACWVNLVGACARGYSSSRCQICSVVLLLGGLLLAGASWGLLGRTGFL